MKICDLWMKMKKRVAPKVRRRMKMNKFDEYYALPEMGEQEMKVHDLMHLSEMS